MALALLSSSHEEEKCFNFSISRYEKSKKMLKKNNLEDIRLVFSLFRERKSFETLSPIKKLIRLIGCNWQRPNGRISCHGGLGFDVTSDFKRALVRLSKLMAIECFYLHSIFLLSLLKIFRGRCWKTKAVLKAWNQNCIWKRKKIKELKLIFPKGLKFFSEILLLLHWLVGFFSFYFLSKSFGWFVFWRFSAEYCIQ